MTLKEKIEAVLNERSFEIHDGPTRMDVVDSVDFEKIALDLIEILTKDYNVDAET